jgi:hypothetical protein
MAKPKTERATAGQVREALRKRYSAPAFALFEEVGNATGFGCSRHADAVAVSLWPSRGLSIQGIEIKVSRSDWVHELNDPAKADAIQTYCDHWWLAVGDETIVQAGELPENWGLLLFSGGKMVCKKEAPKLEPKALDRNFVAALLRRAHESTEKIRQAGYASGLVAGREGRPDDQQRELDRRDSEITRLKNSIETFEKASGIKLDRWNAGSVGNAVARMAQLNGSYRNTPQQLLERMAESAEMFAKSMRNAARHELDEREIAATVPQLSEAG